jgi:H+-transporting ATPase
VAMVAEALLFLYFCWSRFDLAPIADLNDKPLHTFSFLILLYFAVFSVASARERRWFWATMPSKSLMAALTADAIVGTVLALVGLPGLAPLPWWQILAIFGFALVSCLVVNDTLKVILIKRLVPAAVA